MMEERITSRNNPLLRQVKKLFASRKEREETGLFVADGVKLLREAVAHWPGLEVVILSDGVDVTVPEGVRLVRVPEDVMASISPMQAPQGAIFVCRMEKGGSWQPSRGMLLLDGIQDPGNLGTILRTADALNVQAVLLEGCADPFGPKTVRASMGAVFRTPPVQMTWQQARKNLREAGIEVAATTLHEGAVDIRRAAVGQMAVVIGSEGQGVRQEIIDGADHWLVIPMNPRCESLNAAVAAAIVMWQMQG